MGAVRVSMYQYITAGKCMGDGVFVGVHDVSGFLGFALFGLCFDFFGKFAAFGEWLL